jgi:hypothetical protein
MMNRASSVVAVRRPLPVVAFAVGLAMATLLGASLGWAEDEAAPAKPDAAVPAEAPPATVDPPAAPPADPPGVPGSGVQLPLWDDQPVAPQPATVPAVPPAGLWGDASPAVTDQQVRAAIERGVAFLKKVRDDDGLYTGQYQRGYPFGETAMALLALRYAGVGTTDPAFDEPFKRMSKYRGNQVYVNSLIAQVLAAIPKDKHTQATRMAMREQAAWMGSAQLANGMWTYHNPNQGQTGSRFVGSGDNSNTQFAMMALWQLNTAGAEPNLNVLKKCEKHFLETQLADGGWGYTKPVAMPGLTGGRVVSASTPSMTATGLATMYIFMDVLHVRDGGNCRTRRLAPGGQNQYWDRRIASATDCVEAGLDKWFAGRAKQEAARASRPGMPLRPFITMYDLYYLYSIERIGAASGQKYLGHIDWYAAGAKLLLDTQNEDGSWGYTYTAPAQLRINQAANWPIIDTSFAILFLAKGRAPIFINKLSFDGDWNNDPRDAANLTRYASDALETHFNWQIIDIKSDVDGWFDAPLVYLSGTAPPKLTLEQKTRLQHYIAKGGCLLAGATCAKPEFVDGVKALGAELWPDVEWKKLDDTHALFTRQSHFDLKDKPQVWALTDKQGFAFFLLAVEDVGCVWHQNLTTNQEDWFRFGINAVRYAARGKPIRPRLDRTAAKPAAEPSAAQK